MTAAATVTAGDIEVSYRRGGAGEPLLYLHGLGLTDRWLPLHAELAASFDVVAPDLPGFGRTLRPGWFRGIDDIAVHLAELCDALDLERVHLVGHSFGAKVAASFAALYPERMLSLTLVAPAPLATVTPAAAFAPRSGPRPDAAALEEKLFSGDQDRFVEFHGAGDLGGRWDADPDPHADPSAWSNAGSPTLYRRLARLRGARVQVLVPEDDRILPPDAHTPYLAAVGGEATVVRGAVAATGHLVVVQEPTQIAAAVRKLAG